jgi:hypothetical protein
MGNGRVVDYSIDLAKPSKDLICKSLYAPFISDVRLDEGAGRFAPLRADPIGGSATQAFIDLSDYDLSAQRSACPSALEPDAATCTSDEDYLTFEGRLHKLPRL